MKKTFMLLALAALISVSDAWAQHGPSKGSFSTEINFSPFNNDGKVFSLENGYSVKGRYFLTDKDALRLAVGFAMGSGKYGEKDENSASYMRAKSGDFSLDLGYERHFLRKGRIDLYVGAEVGLHKHFASLTDEYDGRNATTHTFKKKFTNHIPSGYEAYGISPDNAYLGIGGNLFLGIDLYLYKGLYIGTEVGLSCRSDKYNQHKMQTQTDEGYNELQTNFDLRNTEAGFHVEPAIRLGWTF